MLKRRRIRSIAPQREIAPRGKDATRRNLGNHQLLRRPFVRLMKDNPRPEKRVLRETSLLSKAIWPKSNLACLMGTLFALLALKLGGW